MSTQINSSVNKSPEQVGKQSEVELNSSVRAVILKGAADILKTLSAGKRWVGITEKIDGRPCSIFNHQEGEKFLGKLLDSIKPGQRPKADDCWRVKPGLHLFGRPPIQIDLASVPFEALNREHPRVKEAIEAAHKRCKSIPLSGDTLWPAIQKYAADKNQQINRVGRMGDCRGVLLNNTGKDLRFRNPAKNADGDHIIQPGKAVMIMFKGGTPAEQYEKARGFIERFKDGITDGTAFENELEGSEVVREAYGPAPFQEMVDKLKPGSGTDLGDPNIRPGGACGFREPTDVFAVRVIVKEPDPHVATLKGVSDQDVSTTAENIPAEGIILQIDPHTGATRPIQPEHVDSFYTNPSKIPTVIVDANGCVVSFEPAPPY